MCLPCQELAAVMFNSFEGQVPIQEAWLVWSRLADQEAQLALELTKNIRAETVNKPKKAKKSDNISKTTVMVVQGSFAFSVSRGRNFRAGLNSDCKATQPGGSLTRSKAVQTFPDSHHKLVETVSPQKKEWG
ncbi:hypothetical protein WISP_102068 [Willisornis vidua]|uniref:Uncharacterized protein n=1 Tax=Willisornis vidua TaxID=1566151 RepID=A0ABQ9D133_9PASS|nr:hypothetical protein WISP_102068 [Willisornis vidua]